MQIRRVQLHPLEVPMSRPIKMAGETLTHAHTLLVAISDEQGRTGWGEASAAPLMTGETLESLLASASHLGQRLVGQMLEAPADIQVLFDGWLYGNASARAGLETALMDLWAQRAGRPLHALLRQPGDAPAAPLPMLHMLASGDLQAELDEARSLRAQGCRQWKIKVGAGRLENDLDRVRGLCSALQGDVISADANQVLSVEAATALAELGREVGLRFLEQPFRAGRADLMAALHARTGLALCADESIHDGADIQSHAAQHAAQGVSLKLIKFGGTQALTQAGREALALGLHLNLACKVAETTISAAATAHVGMALGRVAWGFSMSNRYLAQDVCAQPLAPLQGAVLPSQLQAPGLGFKPEPARLRDFASRTLKSREWLA